MILRYSALVYSVIISSIMTYSFVLSGCAEGVIPRHPATGQGLWSKPVLAVVLFLANEI
jgi:hypothetical protein